MTGSVALDVVIGLVFVYLLYSLLTTTLTEIISSWSQLRAVFLVKGISRMLDDGSGTQVFSDKFFKQPLIKYLGSVNLIGRVKKPAYLSAQNFSKNLFEVLKAEDRKPLTVIRNETMLAISAALCKTASLKPEELAKKLKKGLKDFDPESYVTVRLPTADKILEVFNKAIPTKTDEDTKTILEKLIQDGEQLLAQKEGELNAIPLVEKMRNVLDDPNSDIAQSETVRFIRSLLDDAQNDLEKFKAYLEQWYDDTMERVTGWFKRRIQIITFLIGLIIAVAFNADTLSIVNTLSKDPKARDQMVQLATAYMDSHPAPQGSTAADSSKKDASLDSLLMIKKEIEKDIQGANSVLGLGWNFPDSLSLYPKDSVDAKRKKNSALDFLEVTVNEKLETRFIPVSSNPDKRSVLKLLKINKEGYITGTNSSLTKVSTSTWRFFWASFWGYLLTAVALSLGAPFWFDMLNKLVKLRSSVQVTAQSPSAPSEKVQDKSTPIVKRHG